jgi:hypothetical protein
MSLQRFTSALQEIDEDTSGGILCSAGIKRDDEAWDIGGISYGDELPVNVEHSPPPVGVFIRIGRVTVNGMPALAGVWKWGPNEVLRVAETRALVKAGIYNALSAGIIPLERERIDGVSTVTKADLLEASIVSVPADPLAKITQRSLGRDALGRIFRSLPRVPDGAIERMLDHIRRSHAPSKPVGLMSAHERTAFYAEQARRRTMAVWAAGQASAAEARERRRAEAEHLEAIGESYTARRQ